MASQFADMKSSSTLFDAILLLLSSLVTGPGFMSISSLVLELRQFYLPGSKQKSRNPKYPRLSLVQNLETGAR